MPFPFKKTILIFSTFLSQVMLAGGNQILVLCFGEDGHLAIETSHSDHPYAPYNKHGHPEYIDFTAGTQDSDYSPVTGCLDFPIYNDEDQKVPSGVGFKPPPLQKVLAVMPPIERTLGPQRNRVSARSKYEAEFLRILETVILLI